MDVVSKILEKATNDAEKYPTIHVNKNLELQYDLGSLLANDNNELDAKLLSKASDDYLRSLTRENVQLLYNKLWDLPTKQEEEAIVVCLPCPTFILPRSKRVPKPRPLTKWEEFAKLKGIQKKKKSKLSWDEQLKKWVPLYGYKKAALEREKDWVLEVPQNSDPMEDQFTKRKLGKDERVSKNELQRLRNVAKSKNVKVPRVGLPNPDTATAKELAAAITVARSSTASLGKFQDKLPKEKEARGVTELIPGASRKRKLPLVSTEQERKNNLDIMDSVLNKRPKINMEKAVAKHIHNEQIERSEEKKNTKPKAGKRGKGRTSNFKSGKKPAGGKGQRKGSGNPGRKRR